MKFGLGSLQAIQGKIHRISRQSVHLARLETADLAEISAASWVAATIKEEVLRIEKGYSQVGTSAQRGGIVVSIDPLSKQEAACKLSPPPLIKGKILNRIKLSLDRINAPGVSGCAWGRDASIVNSVLPRLIAGGMLARLDFIRPGHGRFGGTPLAFHSVGFRFVVLPPIRRHPSY